MLKQRSKVVSQVDGRRLLEKERVRIRKALLKSAGPDTACWPEQYRRKRVKSPLYLHCAAAATVIQALYGGVIVTGRIKGEPHYWNRLPNGEEVDFTSCQFGGDGFNPLRKGRKVRDRNGLVPLRYLLFARKVMDNL